MKKILSVALSAILLFSAAACSNGGNTKGTETQKNNNKTEKTEMSQSAEPGTSQAGENTTEPEGTVVVYSPHDADPLNAGINAFMEKYPNVKVEVVAAGTGELLNRIKAESNSPLADVLWGGGADSLAAFKDYFAPYVCANDEFIDEKFKDKDDLWIGESPLPMVLFYNKELLEKDGIPVPQSWNDLLKPELKGKIAFTLPSKSGSAYTQLVTMILGHGGKEDGWKFIEDLYANLDGKMLDSSSKAHKLVADGEYYVGLTLEKAAVLYKDNDNVGFVYPNDGTSAVPDGVALVKDGPNPDNAKLFIDFVTSKECQMSQMNDWSRRPVRSDIEVAEGLDPLTEIELVDYDFDWAANNKEEIIERFNDIMVG